MRVPPGHAKPAWRTGDRHEPLGWPSQPPRAQRRVPAVHSCLKFVIQQPLRRGWRVIPSAPCQHRPCSLQLSTATGRDSGQVQRPRGSPRRSLLTARYGRGRSGARSPVRGLVHFRPAPAAVDRPTRIRISRERLRPATYRPVSGIGEDVGVRSASRAALKPTVPDTCPDRTPASTFTLVRRVYSNPLRSRERRFESYRGHWSEV